MFQDQSQTSAPELIIDPLSQTWSQSDLTERCVASMESAKSSRGEVCDWLPGDKRV